MNNVHGYIVDHTHRLDDDISLQVVDLLVVKVVFQVPVNWLQFLVHAALWVVAEVLDSQSMTLRVKIESVCRSINAVKVKTHQLHGCEEYCQTHVFPHQE